MVKEKIKAWLEEAGIFREEIEDEKADFHYVVEFPLGSRQSCEIVNPKGKDIVVFGSRLVLAEKHYKALHSLPKAQKFNLLWQIRFDLLFTEPEFRIIPSAEEFKSIEFTRTLYHEEINKPAVFRAMKEIYRCKLYIIWKMAQLISSVDEAAELYQ